MELPDWCVAKVLGFCLIAVMAFSVYGAFVYAVNGVVYREYVDSVSLSSLSESCAGFEFELGDVLVVSARVIDANVYYLDIFDEGDVLVFHSSGSVGCENVSVRVCVDPPFFGAGRLYRVDFHAGWLNYPLVGMVVTSSASSGFGLVKSETRLKVNCSYANESNGLRLTASLFTDDLKPVANKTIDFYLQPNANSSKRDGGWVCLGSRRTDENGTASFYGAVSMMGGYHGLEARFAGDDDYAPCSNRTSFRVEPRVPTIKFVKVEKRANRVDVVLRLVNRFGFPLAGRLLDFEFLNLQRSSLMAMSNQTGYLSLSFGLDEALQFVDSRITVVGDEYTSRLQTVARLNVSGSKVSFEVGGGGSEYVENGADVRHESEGSFGLASDLALMSGPGSVGVSVNPNPAKADLHSRVTARLVVYDEYEGVEFYYYLDGTSLEGVVTADVEVVLIHEPDVYRYTYSAELLWFPDYWGSRSFVVEARDGYGQLISQGSKSFTVDAAPANMVVYYPEAFKGDSMKLSIAVSKSRTYENASQSSYFQSFRLAPTLKWDSTDYMLDQETNSTIVHIFVNGSRAADVCPDSRGLCSVSLSVSFSSHAGLNVTAVTNETSRYKRIAVERVFPLTKINVTNVAAGGSEQFKMNYSLSGLEDGNRTYLNLNNTAEARISLLDLPVYNIGTHFIVLRIGARSATNRSGWASIPLGYSYMRVRSACRLEPNMTSPLADVDKSGEVDDLDIAIVSALRGSAFGDSRYDWRFDLNADYQIDQADIDIVIAGCSDGYGRVSYIEENSLDYSSFKVSFDTGTSNYLDTQGMSCVPSAARWLNMSIGGIVEFFAQKQWVSKKTDNVGVASVSWLPTMTGLYLFWVTLIQPPLFVPKSFNVTVALESNVTRVNASLSFVDYYCVFKRPMSLNIDVEGEFHTSTLEAEVDAYVINCEPYNHGASETLQLGPTGLHEPWARLYVRFNTLFLPENACVLSAKLGLYCYLGPSDSSDYMVHHILDPWDESSISGTNEPSCVPTPSCVFTVHANLGYWFFADVTEDVRSWVNDPWSNHGLVLKGGFGTDHGVHSYSREYSSGHPVLEVSCFSSQPAVVLTARDGVTHESIENLSVEGRANGELIGSGLTNSSGVFVASGWNPASNTLFNISATCWKAGSVYVNGYVSELCDLRLPTSIVSSCGNSTTADVGSSKTFDFRLVSSSWAGVENVPVKFYVNGTTVGGSFYSWNTSGVTSYSGLFSFGWVPNANGTYCVRAVFEGAGCYLPCECYVAVTVRTRPYALLFSVSKTQFEPGACLTLNATVLDAFTGLKVTDVNVSVRFFNTTSEGITEPISEQGTGSSGEVVLPITYPADGKAHAYMAKIVPACEGVNISQGMVSNPVQLSVSRTTGITLNVSRNSTSSTHLIQGWLEHDGVGVSGKQVKLTVNETVFMLTTDSAGGFCVSRDLEPQNNQTTLYMITVCFEGDSPLQATAWVNALDGTPYAACTTIQFNYLPSTSQVPVTVEPQATDIIADSNATATQDSVQMPPSKTSEQIEREARETGGLRQEDRWTWSYPWYLLRVQLNITFRIGNYSVELKINVEFNPVLPGGETYFWEGLEVFANTLEACMLDFQAEVIASFIEYIVAKGLSLFPPAVAAAVAVMAFKALVQGAWLYTDWNDPDGMLAFVLCSVIMGLIAVKAAIGAAFINALFSTLYAGTMSALYLLGNGLTVAAAPLDCVRSWVDNVELLMDLCFGFAAAIRYLDLIGAV